MTATLPHNSAAESLASSPSDFANRLVLGIETSCDETAAAVTLGGTRVLSTVVASQHELHAEYRGVVPEIASRAHAERIVPIITEAVRAAGIRLTDLHAVAVGNRPGLIGSLLVGVSAGKAVALGMGVPLIGVDHVQAHLYAGLMQLGDAPPLLTASTAFPALGLVVSGGHTTVYRVSSPTAMSRLGWTIDDAIGEAYDKVAAMLGLPFPGGPNVDTLARTGNAARFNFPISRLDKGSLNFSFSGLKTAVLYTLKGIPGELDARPPLELTPANTADICASFQHAAVKAVILKLERALEASPDCRTLLTGGGVTANSHLRAELTAFAARRKLALSLPAMALCVDNAAMIAGLGHHLLAQRGWSGDGLDLTAFPSGSV
jgi:N6-L-threonylcarbamoyladenine synthase